MSSRFNKVFQVRDIVHLEVLGYAVGSSRLRWFGDKEYWFQPDPQKTNPNVVSTSSVAKAKLYKTKQEAFMQISEGYEIREVSYCG